MILRALCGHGDGHGHFDLAAYDSYLSGNMVDEVSDARFAEGLATIPSVG